MLPLKREGGSLPALPLGQRAHDNNNAARVSSLPASAHVCLWPSVRRTSDTNIFCRLAENERSCCECVPLSLSLFLSRSRARRALCERGAARARGRVDATITHTRKQTNATRASVQMRVYFWSRAQASQLVGWFLISKQDWPDQSTGGAARIVARPKRSLGLWCV